MKPIATAAITADPKSNAIISAAWCSGFLMILLALSVFAASDVLAKPAPQSQSNSNDGAPDQPVELGDVHWKRDLDDAVADSKKQDKPIALLFQEVPG